MLKWTPRIDMMMMMILTKQALQKILTSSSVLMLRPEALPPLQGLFAGFLTPVL